MCLTAKGDDFCMWSPTLPMELTRVIPGHSLASLFLYGGQ